MFRLIFVFLALTSAAHSAPRYHEEMLEGTKQVCILDLSDQEYDRVWNRMLQELEFAGYKIIERGTRDRALFSNGFYKVFVSPSDEGPCVQYMDPHQPEIPAMYQGNL